MRILLSAFSCLPRSGSEPGVAWQWMLQLAKDHDVIVLTDETRRGAIEAHMNETPAGNVNFVFYRPAWLRWLPLTSRTAQVLYSLWQYSLLPLARRLNRRYRFHLIIHLTYGVYRHPSFLGFVGPPFVFGPVGGGEDAPWQLKQSLPPSEKARERLRSLGNWVATFNPFLWVALKKAQVIFVRTGETGRRLPHPLCQSAVRQQEVGVDITAFPEPKAPTRGRSPLKVIFVGRLLGWKGVHLALRAIHQASRAGHSCTLTIVGRGPAELWLRRLGYQLGIDHMIHWIDHLPQDQLFQLYADHDCFLFPSLHDSGGSVVLEAQSAGLPVICLDLGGPPTLVASDSAFVIDTHEKVEHDVIQGLSNALVELADSEEKRLAMSRAARRYAHTRTWERVVKEAMDKISQRIEL